VGIGTGKTATPEIAVDAHKIIRAEVAKLLGADVAAAVRILYGGSVKPDNAHSLIARKRLTAPWWRRQPQARLIRGHRQVLTEPHKGNEQAAAAGAPGLEAGQGASAFALAQVDEHSFRDTPGRTG